MQVNLLERQLPSQLNTHHNHPGDPEKQDIVSSFEERVGVKVLEISSFFGPSGIERVSRGEEIS